MGRKKINILLYVLSALLLASGVFLVIRQYVLIPGEYVPPDVDAIASPAPTATPGATSPWDTGAQPSATPGNTPEETPYVQPIPLRIYFIDAEVMCDIVPVGRIEEGEKAGQMDTVEDPDLAAWYEHGPSPGEPGNALLNGHKSLNGKIGRFSVLWNMKEGELIAVALDNGSVRYFAVASVEFYPYNAVPSEVMDMDSETPRITLITCYGEFDKKVGTSKQRCVVVADLIPDDDPRINSTK